MTISPLSATPIAASGMQAASLMLAASASNLANMQSDGPLSDPARAYQPVRVDQVSIGASGGTAATLGHASPATTQRYDPSAPYAAKPGSSQAGLVAAPAVDPLTETTNQIYALAQFRCCAKMVTAADTMVKRMLDTTG